MRMRRSARTTALRLFAVLTALAVVLAACGTTDDEPAAAPEPVDDTDDADVDEPADDDEPVEVVELRLATLLPPGGSIMGLIEWYIAELETRTGGAFTAEIAYGGSLLPGPEILPGIQEGRAEGGLVVPAYYPGDLPLFNLIMVPVQGHNQAARPRAVQAMYDNNEAFRAEFDNVGMTLIGWTPNNAQAAVTTVPVRSIADYDGLRMRIPGLPAIGYELMGVEPLFLTVEEVYESLQRGVIDGVTFPFDVHVSVGTYEVGDYFIDDGLGQSGMATFAIATEVYESLPQSVRAVMDELQDEWYDKLDELLIETDEAACDTILEHGNEVIVFDDAEKARVAELTGDAMLQGWRSSAIDAGVAEDVVDSVWDEYVALVEEFTPQVSYENGLRVCYERQQAG